MLAMTVVSALGSSSTITQEEKLSADSVPSVLLLSISLTIPHLGELSQKM